MHDTRQLLKGSDFPAIFRKPLKILQVNLVYLCHLSCVHCHVSAELRRTELMSLETLSIDWQGYVYDCDFNQMLSMPLGAVAKPRVHIGDLALDTLNGAAIATAAHCYGCTAGQGSSCGGAL